jgi:hypothetical protein
MILIKSLIQLTKFMVSLGEMYILFSKKILLKLTGKDTLCEDCGALQFLYFCDTKIEFRH